MLYSFMHQDEDYEITPTHACKDTLSAPYFNICADMKQH